jgi:acyl-CoA synthetase (AMP-forming)/AMP-acid ligase II
MSDQRLAMAAEPLPRWCRERPGAIAVIENNVSYTYSTLASDVARAVKALAAAGVQPRMIVGIECEPRYSHLVILLACEALGAAHVAMVAAELTGDNDLAPRCDMLCIQAAGGVVPPNSRVIRLSPLFFETMARHRIADDDLERLRQTWPETDLVRIGRTSGTTGRAKYLGYDRRSLRNSIDMARFALNARPGRENYIAMYLFNHMATYTDTMLALRHGATVVFSLGHELAINTRKLPDSHVFLIVRDAITILNSGQFQEPARSLTLRISSGFAPATLRQALRRSLTPDLFLTYSTNETHYLTTSHDDGAGVVLPDVSVRIVDEAGHDVPPGESGTVLLRTTRMATGYLWDEAQTAKDFVDGWYRTSDIGVIPEPGKLAPLGRIDDMINLGGMKLAPEPIEERIRTMEGVTDAVLLSVDNAMGEGELHIFIEQCDPPRDRAVDAVVTPFLIGYVTTFAVHYMDRFPRTQTGKARRDELRQALRRGTV